LHQRLSEAPSPALADDHGLRVVPALDPCRPPGEPVLRPVLGHELGHDDRVGQGLRRRDAPHRPQPAAEAPGHGHLTPTPARRPHRGHLGAGDVVTCAPRFTPRPIELERYPSSLTTPTVPMPDPCALTRTPPANHTEGGPLMGLRDF